MKVILFGASGMVGQAVLRECLRDPSVEHVLAIGRSRTGTADPKLEEIVHNDLWQYGPLELQLAGYDACFFCLGISSGDVSADEYERITYGITLAAAETLARLNSGMTFVYVSGAGTDSSESGRVRWARVKGRTENALLRLPLHAYMFRPGVIQPLDGIQSRTRSYRLLYAITGPVLPLLRRMFPNSVLTTREIGRAMIAAARNGAPKHILESRDIRELGR
jgi:uncharacterized protein YbjT (DUF2867 family)